MKELKLKAKLREGTGKSFAKKLRNEGDVPGVVYGHGEPALCISVKEKDFHDITKKSLYGVEVVNLEIKGRETFWSLVKIVQKDPITEKVLHIDFQHLHKGEKITVDVPIRGIGTPVGEKEGGILEQVAHEIKVSALPSNISSVFTVDVSQLEIGDSVHIKDLDIGDADLEDNPEKTVFHVVTPRVVEEVKEEVEEVPEVVEEIAEGEEEEKKEKEEK